MRSPVQPNECQSSRIIFVTSTAMFPASVAPFSNLRRTPVPPWPYSLSISGEPVSAPSRKPLNVLSKA